jgi:hypothetical protein
MTMMVPAGCTMEVSCIVRISIARLPCQTSGGGSDEGPLCTDSNHTPRLDAIDTHHANIIRH